VDGEQVETLEDLLRPGLRAVCVGISPAPTSVAAGHYYQGQLGQKFYARLRRAGWLPDKPGCEDDLAFANGIGFTDIVKRPTANVSMVSSREFAFRKAPAGKEARQCRAPPGDLQLQGLGPGAVRHVPWQWVHRTVDCRRRLESAPGHRA
jgi:hypothetical protein